MIDLLVFPTWFLMVLSLMMFQKILCFNSISWAGEAVHCCVRGQLNLWMQGGVPYRIACDIPGQRELLLAVPVVEDWSCTKRLYVATDPCTHLSVDFSLYGFVVIEFILLTWPALFVKVYDLYLLDCNAFFCSVQNKLNKTINI